LKNQDYKTVHVSGEHVNQSSIPYLLLK